MSDEDDPHKIVAIGQALIPDVEGKLSPTEKRNVDDAVATMRQRATIGYWLGAAALGAALGLAFYSFCSLNRMETAFAGDKPPPLEAFYVTVGGHAVVTIALVWFIYQVLRAAERMALPRHLANDPDIARTLLGISSPQREVQQLLKQALGIITKTKPDD